MLAFSNELSGARARQNRSGERESPWKIPLLILIGLDVIDPSAWLRCKVVFQHLMLSAIKLTVTGQIL